MQQHISSAKENPQILKSLDQLVDTKASDVHRALREAVLDSRSRLFTDIEKDAYQALINAGADVNAKISNGETVK